MLSPDFASLELALRGGAAASLDEDVLRGLAAEHQRLGVAPYVIVVHHQLFDEDGMVEWVSLMDAFQELDAAHRAAEALSHDLLQKELIERTNGRVWRLDSEGRKPFIFGGAFAVSGKVGTQGEWYFKVRGGPYDIQNFSVRVVGKFDGPVVSRALIDFVAMRQELAKHFREAAWRPTARIPRMSHKEDLLRPPITPKAPRGKSDLIDALEEVARRHGHVQVVGPAYYEAFAALRPEQVERLTLLVMMNHEQEVRRLSKGTADEAAVEAVSGTVGHSLLMMANGLAMFDGFGTFVITARDGPEPTVEESVSLIRALESFRPWVRDTVRRFLPWQMSQGTRQTTLGL